MNETYANMRAEDIELVSKSIRATRVNSSSIRREKDEKRGNEIDIVYILRGDIMNARKIEIFMTQAIMFSSARETEASNGGYRPIKRYDEVIVKMEGISVMEKSIS